jgi:hypothetical protein
MQLTPEERESIRRVMNGIAGKADWIPMLTALQPGLLE